jgi:hypothetical protein
MRIALKKVRDLRGELALVTKRRYDKGRKPLEYKKGDLLLLVDHSKTNKLLPKFSGPYEVQEVASPLNVLIKSRVTGKTRKVHVENTLPFHWQARLQLELAERQYLPSSGAGRERLSGSGSAGLAGPDRGPSDEKGGRDMARAAMPLADALSQYVKDSLIIFFTKDLWVLGRVLKVDEEIPLVRVRVFAQYPPRNPSKPFWPSCWDDDLGLEALRAPGTEKKGEKPLKMDLHPRQIILSGVKGNWTKRGLVRLDPLVFELAQTQWEKRSQQ